MKWPALLALLTVLAGCGGEDGADPDAGESPSATAGATAASQSPATDAEATFLRLTAEHLCLVQSSVYDDPADLAAAYEQAPDYPGVSAEQVAELEVRVVEDPEFSAELVDALADTCG